MLIDNHGRPVTYLRLAVTDRCNLRCLYCMPANGLQWVPKPDLLSFEEILRLLRLYARMGITKLRLTGGEPFLRKDLMTLIRAVAGESLFDQWSITTNGTLIGPHLAELRSLGIHSVNLSLDTFDPDRFSQMTRRNDFSSVLNTFHTLLDMGVPVRINAVIMDGKNDADIEALARLTLQYPVAVRFIEEMPFNGVGGVQSIRWNWKQILQELQRHFPDLMKIPDEAHSTAMNYQVPGAPGHIGIIAAYSRTFCGSCNRIRLTPAGQMKTCLYDSGALDLREMLRTGASEGAISEAILTALGNRPKDGFEAEARRRRNPVSESMATIGG